MFIKGKGHIVIGTTQTTTKTTGIQIQINGEGKGEVPTTNPGRFPLSLPKKKPVPNGLPASTSGKKKPIGTVIPSLPFGQQKK